MPKTSQLELPLIREREPDRNLAHGGRSFYFFDFDDNVAFLATPTFLFHRQTGAEIQISSRKFTEQSRFIGKQGIYADYVIDEDPVRGSFRNFRDLDPSSLEHLRDQPQMFVQDLATALGIPDVSWQGPSWNCFYHAVFNGRPLALITARGHHPETLRQGIDLWVREGHLPQSPNYLGLYPVNHPAVQKELGLEASSSVPRLKQRAVRAAVQRAFEVYGRNPHHRFGMSDDDPRNIEWILAEMRELKRENPQNGFFIIQTHGNQMTKLEVFTDHVIDQCLQPEGQLSLFEE